MSLAENLRAARTATGASQQQVADVIGIQRTALSDIEHGSRAVSAIELKAFAELFGTSTDALLDHQVSNPVVNAPGGLVVRLEKVVENLHGYLEQRAQELAQPHIEAVSAIAEENVRRLEHELQRANDLLGETRRVEHRLGMKHPAGECDDCDKERLAATGGGSCLD